MYKQPQIQKFYGGPSCERGLFLANVKNHSLWKLHPILRDKQPRK